MCRFDGHESRQDPPPVQAFCERQSHLCPLPPAVSHNNKRVSHATRSYKRAAYPTHDKQQDFIDLELLCEHPCEAHVYTDVTVVTNNIRRCSQQFKNARLALVELERTQGVLKNGNSLTRYNQDKIIIEGVKRFPSRFVEQEQHRQTSGCVPPVRSANTGHGSVVRHSKRVPLRNR